MKNFKYIFILFFIFSCNDVNKIIESTVEEVTVLENDFLIKEAWIEIEEKTAESLDRAFEIFNDIIFNDALNADPYSRLQAYHGLGWAQMFYSNTLSGIENADDRLHYRELAYDSFFGADSIYKTIPSALVDLQEYKDNLDSDEYAYDFEYECDILVGKILYSDYKIYHFLNEYYGSDSSDEYAYYLDYVNDYSTGEFNPSDDIAGGTFEVWDFGESCDNSEANDNPRCESSFVPLYNKLISVCSNYNMSHASIDIKNINILLIKNWIRKGLYSDAANFIIQQQDNYSHTLNFILEFDQNIQPNSDVKLLGDFSNKTINSDDLFNPYLVDEGNYLFEIDMLSYLPCQVENYSIDNLDGIEKLRNELLECIDIYFETNSEVTFRYKYVNGGYESSIDNQEFYNQSDNSGQDCIDNEGFRTISIPIDSPETISVPLECFNSCSPCNID